VSISPDGKRLATGGFGDGTIKIFNLETGKEMKSVNVGAGMVVMLQFDAKGRHVVYNVGAGGIRPLRALDIETGRSTNISEEIGTLQAVDFSSDGRYMAGVAQGALVVWDAKSWKEVRRFEGRFSSRSFSAFSRDGSHVAAADAEGNVRIWSIEKGREALNLGVVGVPNRAIKFSHDGTKLFVPGKDNKMSVYASRSR